MAAKEPTDEQLKDLMGLAVSGISNRKRIEWLTSLVFGDPIFSRIQERYVKKFRRCQAQGREFIPQEKFQFWSIYLLSFFNSLMTFAPRDE